MTLQPNAEISFFSFPAITREQLRAYSQASGDLNPIHLDEEVAKKMGLPGIIAHGMLIASLISERAERLMRNEAGGGSSFRWVSFQTRFKSMTLLGDVPSVGGLVKGVQDRLLVLDLQAKNQRGEVTTTAVAKILLLG